MLENCSGYTAIIEKQRCVIEPLALSPGGAHKNRRAAISGLLRQRRHHLIHMVHEGMFEH